MKTSTAWENMVGKARAIHIRIMCARLGINLERKAKGSWFGHCPFCKNETPNLHISPDKGRCGLYYCLDCHQGGDPLALYMEVRKKSFPESVKILIN